MTRKEVRQLTFEDLKELLRNPFQALVEEGDTTHICEYGDEKNKVIEEVSLSSEVHKLLRHLGSSSINSGSSKYYTKCDSKNVCQ
ncbi:hypothetical protein [Pseudoalteromonas sp.]|uniref:hypothetical protein n=1 Tax=Pseudoalteromonas sp. TaxID=53249 RepID=UPI002602D33B|nr:hypothetical protein [Pseudoalteromonas sp.]MCP4588643.1 hypothetical protein [Pseudoalteromonas sp.]